MSSDRDVIVIGGGVIGLCTAYYLQKAGRQVTILTRDPVGVGASVGNAGMIVPSHVVPFSSPGVIAQGLRWLIRSDSPFHITPRLSLGLLRWLLIFRRHATADHVAYAAPHLRDLSLQSVAAFEELDQALDDFGLSRSGLMMVYRTEAGYRSQMEAADVAEGVGLEVRRLKGAEVLDLEPAIRSAHTGAVFYPQDGRVDPNALLAGLAKSLAAGGADFIEGVTVSSVESRKVTSGSASWKAEDVVVAAGAWTPSLLPGLPIEAAKGYSITQSADPGGLNIAMILAEERVTITPMPGRLRFGGTLSLSGLDATIDTRRLRPIQAQADLYGPDSSRASVGAWSGFRPCSPDGLPILGPVQGQEGCWVASGHGMMGLSLGPGTGKLMARLIAGEVADATAFSPSRF